MRWKYRHTVLILCTFGFFATMVARLVISPVVPDLTTELNASTGTIGLALTGMWGAYALTQFPSGVLADRYGERLIVLVSVGGTAVASLLLAAVPSYPFFLVFAVVLGSAAGLIYSAATSLVTKQASDTGRAIGIYVSGGQFAGMLAPPAAAAVGARYGWRVALALGAATAIPVVLLFAWRVEPTSPASPDAALREQINPSRAVELLSRPAIAHTTVLSVLGAFAWQSTASFLPAFLEQFHTYPRTTASLLFSGYFLVLGVAQPVVGALSDRYSRDATTTLTMLVGVVGYSLLVGSSSLQATIPAIVLVGLAMSWGAPLQSQYMDELSDESRGTDFGILRTVYVVLGALGSGVTGILADVAGWDVAFGLLAAFMGIGLIILIGSRMTYRRTDRIAGHAEVDD